MQTKLLIDLIVRQTTVLIAQLTTAAGQRSPLAHLADEVFLNLSQELEDQGVSRKVVADMFGLALRGYQRRVQRLRESMTEGGRSLWQAIHDHLSQSGPTTRHQLYLRFQEDDPEAIGAVIQDLVQSGLATRDGTGPGSVIAVTPMEARRRAAQAGKQETVAGLVWLDLCRHPGTSAKDVAQRLNLDDELIESALAALGGEGQLIAKEDGLLEATPLVIPVGSEVGWETAVFDHFQAMVRAIVSKLRIGKDSSTQENTVGGSTLSFEISPTHPLAQEVRETLARFRHQTDELWDRVEKHNALVPIAEEEMQRVIVYFGQYVEESEQES